MAHRRRRRCGPWCCRSVSTLGFALLPEDNLPRSACRASAGVSGCVRDASCACKTSLLTRGTQALVAAAQFALRAQPTRRLRRGCISRPSARRASAPAGLPPAPRLQCAHVLAYNLRRPLETKAPPAHRASLVCGVVDAPGLVGVLSPLSRGPYFISIPTSLGLRTTSFGSIFAMWSFAAVPSP